MRKLSPFAWLVIAVQTLFIVLAIAIWSGRTDCEEQVTEESIEGVVGELVCDVADGAITLLALYGLGLIWVTVNVVLGIVAVIRRKKRSNHSPS